MNDDDVIEVPEGRCPYRWQGDDGTVSQCIERGHCGCKHRPSLFERITRTGRARPPINPKTAVGE